ncbi:MAG: carbohydrate ABC transporter permease [Nakamurella sp.]
MIFLAPAVLVLGVGAGYPLVTLLHMSFSDVQVENLFQTWTGNGLANYRSLRSLPEFHTVVVNTIGFVAVVLIGTVTVGLIAALTLLKRLRVSRFVQALMIMVWVLPPIVVGSLWKFMFYGDGLINNVLAALGMHDPIGFISDPNWALWSVAAVSTWVSIPFAAVVFRAALLDIPAQLLEAASIDGASRAQTLRLIVLPLLRPTLLVVAVLTVVNAFRSFDLIFVMTGGGPGTASATLPFLGYQLAFQQFQYGIGAAAATISMVVVAVLAIGYVWLSRRELKSA